MKTTAARIRRLERRVRNQAGFALPAVLGLSIMLGLTGTTAMVYTTENGRASATSKADEQAFSLAEAGLNNAYSNLYNAADPTMPGALPQRSESVEGGTVTWWGTLDTQTNVWTLTGQGTVSSPGGNVADLVRTVHGRARVTSSGHGTSGNAVWNYMYAEAPMSCMTVSSTTTVTVPLYVKGNLCLQNSTRIDGTNTVLQVGGTLTLQNSAQVGSLGSLLAEVHVGGGCRVGIGPLHSPCTTTDRVYAAMPPDSQTTNLEKPPADLPYWYDHAKPGPRQACTSGSFPGGFDNDTLLNRSRTPAVNLTPPTAYDCQVRDPSGNLLGQISWTPGIAGPGTLTVAGTIFFDGNISMANSVSAVYVGRATIYASGTITMTNSVNLCGIPGCSALWQPTLNLLALVAGSSTDQNGFAVSNNTTFQGAIYVVNDYSETNNANIWGPIIARQITLANTVTNHYVPLGTLLAGMPQFSGEAVSISNEPGSWG
jgi:Tfp pilus assembly protein PilX